jgi:asparagine synthase (glutamine-hydrolysing)
MCGFAGIFDASRQQDESSLRSHIRRMTATLVHRGPDDQGDWADASRGIALGHQRLAIVDLTPSGRQPMRANNGRFVLVYNGEIYNHRDLRRELEGDGYSFCGNSDTEVLLAALEVWGVETALRRSNGMFAFAAWDTRDQRLYLARDRVGIKPLYYGSTGRTLIFGSELKALRAFPQLAVEIDRAALALFLQHNYVPAPYSIYRQIRKLPAGSYLSIGPESIGPEAIGDGDPIHYWNFGEVAEGWRESGFTGTDQAATEALDEALRKAVLMRMQADVPLGAFLSGGLDSTAIVALMQALGSQPVQTFCIGFDEASFDESDHANRIAEHLGTDHTTVRVTASEAQDVIPKLPSLYDEPFADSSQIPTYLVSQLARRAVTVSLSGDGGDELFGGYKRYASVERIWNTIRRLPVGLRGVCATSLRLLSDRLPVPSKVRTMGRFLDCRGPAELYSRFHTHWKQPHEVVIGGNLPITLLDSAAKSTAFQPLEQLMYIDTLTYLPDDILVKLDRASMGVSLEARVPFLDHNVVELAWKLPIRFKVRHGHRKWILRSVVDRYVPRELVDRPKTGFGVPLHSWLRGPLRDWAESLLDDRRLAAEGYFRPAPIVTKWRQHLSGQQNWHYYLWDILMFQAWLEAQTP